MTMFLRAALPLATLLVVPTAALDAKQSPPEITVVAPVNGEVRAWSTRIGQEINQTMRYPRALGSGQRQEGIVDVTFRCSEDGRPSEVALVNSSGSRKLDRAGLSAITTLRSLHPLPAGVGHDQVYRAQMLFAVDDGSGSWRERLGALRNKGDRSNDSLMLRRDRPGVASVVTLMPVAALR